MSKEELIEEMVTAVMEDFDFDRVHNGGDDNGGDNPGGELEG